MGRVIFVTSFKGGVGKTTVTANLAGALTKLNKSVLVIDGDFGMRCMDLVLGFEDYTVFDLYDVMTGKCAIDSAAVYSETNPLLCFLAAPMNDETENEEGASLIEEYDFASLFKVFREKFDFVLVDSGANRNVLYDALAINSDEAIVVSLHQASSIRAAERTATVLSGLGLKEIRLIVNSFRPKDAEKSKLPGIVDIINRSSLKLLGIIPLDDELPSDQEIGRIAFDQSVKFKYGKNKNKKVRQYEKAALNIANRLLKKNVPLFQGIFTPRVRERMLYTECKKSSV